MSASGGRSGATRLFVLFAVASLVPTLVLVVVLGGSLRRDALSRTLSDGRVQGELIAQTVIAPTLADDGLERGLDLGSAADVAAAVDAATAAGSVVRVHLHALSGQLVYPGNLPPDRPESQDVTADELSHVIGGQTLASVRTIEATARSTRGDVVRVLTPVLEPTDDRLVGVLEVWLPYDAVARSITAQSQRLTVLLTLGLVAQYLVVAAISWLVTRRLRRQSAMYQHLANHDPLTELPNRKLFRAQLAECVDQARRIGGTCSVAIVDLDRFKEVNDSLGHHIGDELLRQVSARMQETLRTDDRVARLGGDEFGIVLPGTDDDAAVRVLTAVRDAIAADLDLAGLQISVGSSIGVASFPLHGANVDVLLQHADLAMYAAKSGQRGVMGFDPLATPVRQDRLAIGSDLRRGIAAGELVLHYQPQLRLCGDGVDRVDRVETVEALVRWQHPERGLLYPDSFIEVAEQNDLVDVLTQVVLRDALAQLNCWQAKGHVLRVAVNISAHTMHDRTLPQTVAAHLSSAGLPASRLILELTETALVTDPVAMRAVVAELAGMGLALSLDDFGQGYTSLAYLRGLALSELKIDKAFVQGLATSAQDEAIVRSLVGLAHSLGLTVVAEGVEDADVLLALRDMGCDTAQGYHISRPVPCDQLTAWLSSRSPSAPVHDAMGVR